MLNSSLQFNLTKALISSVNMLEAKVEVVYFPSALNQCRFLINGLIAFNVISYNIKARNSKITHL